MNEYERYNKTIEDMGILIEGNKFAQVIKYAEASIEDIYKLSEHKFHLKKQDNKEYVKGNGK